MSPWYTYGSFSWLSIVLPPKLPTIPSWQKRHLMKPDCSMCRAVGRSENLEGRQELIHFASIATKICTDRNDFEDSY